METKWTNVKKEKKKEKRALQKKRWPLEYNSEQSALHVTTVQHFLPLPSKALCPDPSPSYMCGRDPWHGVDVGREIGCAAPRYSQFEVSGVGRKSEIVTVVVMQGLAFWKSWGY